MVGSVVTGEGRSSWPSPERQPHLCSSWLLLNGSAGPVLPDLPTFQERLEIDLILSEIAQLLNFGIDNLL